ncbi:MAG: hypothetical protein AAF458_02540 [Pseudomonadota bacterium]
MSAPINTLILGASYGSLLATKLVLAGHDATLICLPAERELINAEGVIVRMPVRGRDDLVELNSKDAPGSLRAVAPEEVDPAEFDMIALAMQEPQYRSDGVRELLDAIARSGKPVMSIMNMPPLPFLARIPGLDMDALAACYTDASVWASFNPDNVTLASPDPQAFRPPEEPVNVLQVSLPTNFKVARFADDAATDLMRRMQADIEAIRHTVDGAQVELPVKLKVHESVFVPLAKWCMLLTGNYRCVQSEEMRAIRDAVHADLDASKTVYEWVRHLCIDIGASPDDMVPFEKYANAASGLAKPSSAARALAAGAPNIERVDKIVQTIAAAHGKSLPEVDAIVALVEQWLRRNREAQQAA